MARKLKKILMSESEDACYSINCRRRYFAEAIGRVRAGNDGRSFALDDLRPQVEQVRLVLAEAEAEIRRAYAELLAAEKWQRKKAKKERYIMERDEYDSAFDGVE